MWYIAPDPVAPEAAAPEEASVPEMREVVQRRQIRRWALGRQNLLSQRNQLARPDTPPPKKKSYIHTYIRQRTWPDNKGRGVNFSCGGRCRDKKRRAPEEENGGVSCFINS